MRSRRVRFVTSVTSVVAVLQQVHRADAGGGLTLPDDQRTLDDELDLVDESGHPLVRRFAAPDFRALRIAVRIRAVGTAESAPLVDAIVADARRILGPELTFTPTGALYHVIHDSTRLVRPAGDELRHGDRPRRARDRAALPIDHVHDPRAHPERDADPPGPAASWRSRASSSAPAPR
jgi:hypothetical protein